jgi:plasmid stabilization system protein ParE
MEFEVVLTEPALTDLERVFIYLVQDDPVAAEGVRDGILRSIEVLR